ncbi:peptidase M23 [Clostridium nigeriense]|uniref:peptidase M23 n=1 Tax=Clostridium nigeriense TaxID=1805470 RepID=UPI000832817B|nr:peptidase M23 [Clostridium nigeriense]
MNNNYSEAYKDYYDKMRKKIKGNTNKMDKVIHTREDVYPSMNNVGRYTYKRGSYGVIQEKKNFKYIDRFIIRLICTFVLFLGVFTLKVLPNKEAKDIYNVFKSAISSNINYDKLLSNINISGLKYKDILNSVEEKYSNIKESIDLENLNKVLKL